MSGRPGKPPNPMKLNKPKGKLARKTKRRGVQEDDEPVRVARDPNNKNKAHLSLPSGLPKRWPHSTPEDLAERPVRYITIGGPQHFRYCDNFIQTSRYNSSTFLGKFLLEEFHPRSKPANTYFLFIAILQMIPQVTETYGVPTTLIPLVVIILMDGAITAIEELRRRESDLKANSSRAFVYDPQKLQFKETQWSEVKVGDFIQIGSRDVAPADVLILSVSETSDVPTGRCWVETKSLDGETNLKPKQALSATFREVSTVAALARVKGSLSMEHPNKAIHTFNGVATLDEKGSFRVSHSNVIFRGSVLRSCDWAIALVINTGPDTKILMSAPTTRIKMSDLMEKCSKEVFRVFLFLFVLCTLGSLGQLVWEQNDALAGAWYLDYDLSQPGLNFIYNFVHFLLLHATFIPVSLYVSILIVRYAQTFFMKNDLDMYCDDTGQGANIKNMAVNEDLGQISHILSDKTGTLTRNIMDFRRMSINGICYGGGLTSVSKAKYVLEKMPIPPEKTREEYLAQQNASKHVAFHCPALTKEMGSRGTQRNHIKNFFRVLAMCHDAEIDVERKVENQSEGPSRASDTLSAMNPDDEALIHAADHFGFRFQGRVEDKVRVLNKERGRVEEIEVLQTFQFSSVRRRMGILVREPDGRIMLYVKGADVAVVPLLDRSQKDLIEATAVDRKGFTMDGLRCLYVAQVEISEDFYKKWVKEFIVAWNDVQHIERQKDGESNLIDDLIAEVEKDMELLGCTGIEDKLQLGVAECVEEIQAAGINIWMLTGDNEETAFNIGLACRMLLPLEHSKHIVLVRRSIANKEVLKETLFSAIHQFDYDLENIGASLMKPLFMIIDGACLSVALDDEEFEGCRELLSELSQRCRAVVACRVSPSQKRELVVFMNESRHLSRIMAIGDGANDVGMIKAADVGVGIHGQEGSAAVGVADVALAQFRFLAPLVIKHGQLNYIRMSNVIKYTMYKNVLVSMSMAWFNFFSGFSGQKYYTEGGMQLYNLVFTSLPILIYGAMDMKFSALSVIKFPQSYRATLAGTFFNTLEFWRWIAHGVGESIIVVVLPMYLLTGMELRTGTMGTFWQAGIMSFTGVVIIANVKLLFFQSRWTWHMLVLLAMGPVAWLLCILTVNMVLAFDYDIYYTFNESVGQPAFGPVLIVILTVCIGKDIYSVAIDRHFNYKSHHIIEEYDAYHASRKAKGVVAPMPDMLGEEKNNDSLGELRESNLNGLGNQKIGYSAMGAPMTPGTADTQSTLYTDGSQSYYTGTDYTESRPASSVPATPFTPKMLPQSRESAPPSRALTGTEPSGTFEGI